MDQVLCRNRRQQRCRSADITVADVLGVNVIYIWYTVYPKKYAHGFCFAVLCCGYTLTDFPISTRLTSLALWQSNDCPSAGKETLMNMDKYFMWNHYERLHNHNKAKHNKTVCIFIGIYCIHIVRSYKLVATHVWVAYIILHNKQMLFHCHYAPRESKALPYLFLNIFISL